MFLEYILVTVYYKGNIRLHDLVIVDYNLVGNKQIGLFRADGSPGSYADQVPVLAEGNWVLDRVVDDAIFFEPLVKVDIFGEGLELSRLLPVNDFHVLDVKAPIQLIDYIVYHLPAIILF
jgi:hypothetical protein